MDSIVDGMTLSEFDDEMVDTTVIAAYRDTWSLVAEMEKSQMTRSEIADVLEDIAEDIRPHAIDSSAGEDEEIANDVRPVDE
jgi:hypothetical protein